MGLGNYGFSSNTLWVGMSLTFPCTTRFLTDFALIFLHHFPSFSPEGDKSRFGGWALGVLGGGGSDRMDWPFLCPAEQPPERLTVDTPLFEKLQLWLLIPNPRTRAHVADLLAAVNAPHKAVASLFLVEGIFCCAVPTAGRVTRPGPRAELGDMAKSAWALGRWASVVALAGTSLLVGRPLRRPAPRPPPRRHRCSSTTCWGSPRSPPRGGSSSTWTTARLCPRRTWWPTWRPLGR